MNKTPRPRPFVLVPTEHGAIIANRLDAHLLPSGEAYGVGHQLFQTGSYDRSEIEFVLDVLRNRRERLGGSFVAIDCGANIGIHTLEMAQEMTGWGRVLAFEAQERLFYALCGNIALNNIFNAKAYLCAVGLVEGHIKVPQPNYYRPGSFGSLEIQRTPRTEYIGQTISYAEKDLALVSMCSLDGLQLPRVDFIKIDVEGMEIDVLQGAEKTISAHHPDLLIEWIKSDREKLESFLHSHSYSVREIGGNLFCTQ